MIGFYRNFEFFPKAQDQLKWCFIVFFDVLKLWEPSWNDPGSTLDHSFFYDFFQKIGLNNSTLCAASSRPEWIDLSVYVWSQTFSYISRKLNFGTPKSSRSLNFCKIWLVLLWPRITLKEHRYMLYESFKVNLEAPRRTTHASAWRKCEKWVPKLLQMISFWRNFDFFPEGPGSFKIMFHDGF